MITTKKANGRNQTIQTFNRFGVKKEIIFYPDSGQELASLAKEFASKVSRMTREEYMELKNPGE